MMKVFSIIIFVFVLLIPINAAFAMHFSDVNAGYPNISIAPDYPQRSIYSTDNYGKKIMFLAYKDYLKLMNSCGVEDYMSFIPPTFGHGVSFKVVDVYTSNPERHFWVISAWTAIGEYSQSNYITLGFWLIGQNIDGSYTCYLTTEDLARAGVYLPSKWGINVMTFNRHGALEIGLIDTIKGGSTHPVYARWNESTQSITLSEQ